MSWTPSFANLVPKKFLLQNLLSCLFFSFNSSSFLFIFLFMCFTCWQLALLLHQELNSSPRVPRVPRARHAGSLPQLTSASSTSMLIKRTSSIGGKDHCLVGFCSIIHLYIYIYIYIYVGKFFQQKMVNLAPYWRTESIITCTGT